MYLHLGADSLVRHKDIIAVIDMDKSTVSKTTRDYLTRAQKSGEIINVSEDLPRSFVICGKRGKQSVYITQISSQTLYRRSIRPIDDER